MARGSGFTLDDHHFVTHAVWADNFYLIAKSQAEAIVMANELTAVIYAKGFKWKPASLECLCSSNASFEGDMHVVAPDGEKMKVAGVEHMLALGVLLDRCGSTDTTISHRMAQADKVFYKHLKALANSNGGLEQRLRAFMSSSAATLLYNACGWHLTDHTLLRVKRWENHKIRKMYRLRRRPDEGKAGHMLRTGHKINTWFVNSNVQRSHQRALAMHHGWAAKLVDHVVGRGGRPLYHLLHSRCLQHWHETCEGNSWIDPSNQSGWRHSRPGPQSHWEQLLAKVHGNAWWDSPSGKPSAWRAARHAFVEQVCTMWGLQGRREKNGQPVSFSKCSLAVPQWHTNDLQWRQGFLSFEFRVDNALVASWLTGSASTKIESYSDRVATAVDMLQSLIRHAGWSLRWPHSEWVTWVPRERNVIADALANMCLDKGHNIAVRGELPEVGTANLVMVSDGARRGGQGSCAASWAILSFRSQGISFVAGGAIKFPTDVSSLDAELTGLELAVGALLKYSRGYNDLVPHGAAEILDASELLKSNCHWLAIPFV